MPRVRYMNKEQKKIYNLSQYPNFSATGRWQAQRKPEKAANHPEIHNLQ